MLQNCHLLVKWLFELEKHLDKMSKPHPDFRLWLTSEVHPRFPTILLQTSLKLTYEAPAGVKKNLLRTFEFWTNDDFQRGNSTRSQILFYLAWFHAIVQERRKYIPQVKNKRRHRRVFFPHRFVLFCLGLDEIL